MKRIFLISVVTLVAAAFGCSRDEAQSQRGNIHAKSIEVSIRQDGVAQAVGLGSRAPISPVTDLTRFVLEVYQGSTASGTADRRIEQSTGTFKYDMADGAQYTLLFWADYGTPDDVVNDHYDVSDLKSVRVLAGQTASGDAFKGTMVVTSGQETSYGITLDRGVAQVNFIQKEALLTSDNTLNVTFPQTYSINVSTGVVSEIKDGMDPVPATYSYSGIAKVDAGATLAKGHVIVPSGADNKVLMELTTTFNPNKPDQAVKIIDNVPLQMNYKTNITGAYSNLADLTTTLDCNQVWGTPDFEAGDPIVLQVGYFVYEDGSYSETYIAPTPVASLLGTRAATDTCVGIVFWVDPNQPNRAKVVNSWGSIYMNAYSWGEAPYSDIPGTYSRTDGKANTLAFTKMENYSNSRYYLYQKRYLAKSNGGLEWYMPAIEEVIQISNNIDAVEAAFDVLRAKQTVNRQLPGETLSSSTTASATEFIQMRISDKGASNGVESTGLKAPGNFSTCIAEIVY